MKREHENIFKRCFFTTDSLIELHDGEQINPESNLAFYIQ